tara:strand:- start:1448 stop:1783 length:336 start_codon:yes stop_codon:yes gene_type:complete
MMIDRPKEILAFLAVVLLLLSGCETSAQFTKASSSFSTENVLKIKEGMTQEAVVALFGYPNNVRSMTCSLKNKCKAWEYEQDAPRVRARFVFENVGDSWIVEDFDIQRDGT